jgi:hypothetical protein
MISWIADCLILDVDFYNIYIFSFSAHQKLEKLF